MRSSTRAKATRRWSYRLAAALGIVFVAGMLGATNPPCPAPPAFAPAVTSLLAVGDTGKPVHFPAWLNPQRAVGRALASEAERAPADTLLLLGDNFYYDGLQRETAEQQLRENLIAPYCGFVALSELATASMRSACGAREAPSSPPRILAVLGNHDYGSPESPGLQRRWIPRFVSNWAVAPAVAEVVELRGGVSLILLDSEQIVAGAPTGSLVAALRRSQGPWRVLISHRPIRVHPEETFSRRIAAALQEAGTPVHVVLSGDQHNLQAWVEPGGSPMHVVSGSGGSVKKIQGRGQAVALEELGFVRLDWIRPAPEAEVELHVSLFTASRWPWQSDAPTLRARLVSSLTAVPRVEWICDPDLGHS